jgi:hypothetical protein
LSGIGYYGIRRVSTHNPVSDGVVMRQQKSRVETRLCRNSNFQVTGALSVLIKSELKLQILALTRFLHANRYPLRSKALYRHSTLVIS